MKTLTSMMNITVIQPFLIYFIFFLRFLETVCLVYASTHYHLSDFPPLTSLCECYFCQEIN